MIVVLACRVDGLHPFGHTWAATFWPMWLLFGCLVLASLGAGCLAVGILVTREPRERGQRALFFLCYGILLTITVAGMTFLLNLARLLDGDRSAPRPNPNPSPDLTLTLTLTLALNPDPNQERLVRRDHRAAHRWLLHAARLLHGIHAGPAAADAARRDRRGERRRRGGG